MKKRIIIFLLFGILGAKICGAGESVSENGSQSGFWKTVEMNLRQTWCEGTYDLFVPVNTWHNRLTYDRAKIKEYNERPWGIGIGKSLLRNEDIRQGVFALFFLDSHKDIEPIAGYSWQKRWRLDKTGNWYVSAGGILGVTMRSDFNYIPIPAPLPIVGIEYKQIALESAYVPGLTRNSGNVLFTWIRWRF